MGNKLRFINNANKKLTNCAPKNLLCNTVSRLALYATSNIKAGTELFFHYNYPEETTLNFKQPTQRKDAVVAVKQTAKRTDKPKAKSKPSSSNTHRSPQPSARRELSQNQGHVGTSSDKARAARKRKRDSMSFDQTAESQPFKVSSGPQRALKTVHNQTGNTKLSTTSTLHYKGNKTLRDLSHEDPPYNSDFSARGKETQQLSQSRGPREYHIVQDTDGEDDEFVLEEMADHIESSDDSASEEQNVESGKPSRRKPAAHQSRPSKPKRVTTAVGKKQRGGARPGAGRKRRIVLNSDDE